MKKQNLYRQLKQYSDAIYPMHMPGHKLGRCTNLGSDATIDVTEVEGTDNLHHPKEILLDAQQKAAKTFGARKTYFLVNGSTSGILAAIMASCHEGSQIIVARNCHKSVYNAMLLCRLEPVYIYPDVIERNGIAAGVNPNSIKHILENHPMVDAVVITSPNYEGMTSHIKVIANLVHAYGKILIVDEAHGAHFSFHDSFPVSSLSEGADIVIQSTHKTLPAYTQSAMLHVNSDKIDLIQLQEALSIFQTSSPSYILMNGLDSCRELIDLQGERLFSQYTRMLQDIRLKLSSELQHLALLDQTCIGTYHIEDLDPSKLVIDCSNVDISGSQLDKILREKYGIQVELDGKNHIIAMTSICDQEEGLLAFAEALIQIDKGLKKIGNKQEKYDIINRTHMVYKPSDANRMHKSMVPIESSIGMVSGEFIIPFPPGIPILVPGERITKDVIEKIKEYIKLGIDVMGMEDSTYHTIKIIGEV